MIKRIRILGYKSLRDVEVELQCLTVLIGPNASGKSNFLDALHLLSRMVSPRTRSLGEAFEPPHRGKVIDAFTSIQPGTSEIRERSSTSFTIEADIELSKNVIQQIEDEISAVTDAPDRQQATTGRIQHRFLRYRISVEFLPGQGILRVADESIEPLNQKGEVHQRSGSFLGLDVQRNKLRLRAERRGHPILHDRYLDHTILSRPHFAPHFPHVAALQLEFSRFQFIYLEPRERMRLERVMKEVDDIGPMGEDLGVFLHILSLKYPQQVHAYVSALQAILPFRNIRTEINRMGEVELSLEANDGTVVPARTLSEGTPRLLRLLGLLALRGLPSAPACLVAVEEPEDGVHPGRIPHIAELLKSHSASGSTQVIITTHSPFLPDYLPLESLFYCRADDLSLTTICRIDTTELFRSTASVRALTDEEDRGVGGRISERLLRGDFNGY